MKTVKMLREGLIESLWVVMMVLISIFTWTQPLIMFTLVLIISAFKLWVDRDAAVYYFVAAVSGPLVEIVCVYFGIWSYTLPQFLGIPIWLPLVWGMFGLFLKKFQDIYVEFRRGK